ncbi:endoglucanase [Sphingomonas koreensis]|nr:endoglucanase [Sphingomonas koreensis]
MSGRYLALAGRRSSWTMTESTLSMTACRAPLTKPRTSAGDKQVRRCSKAPMIPGSGGSGARQICVPGYGVRTAGRSNFVMECDRRGLLATTALLCLVGCAPPGGKAVAASPTRDGWARFKAQFIQPDGRVVDIGNNGISHSEGQGYALLLATTNDDRATFDRVLGWTERTLARTDVALFSWRYTPGAAQPVDDPNNATDGDTLIAWALLRAAAMWHRPAYAERSTAIRGAIRAELVSERFGKSWLMPGMSGFDTPAVLVLNPSYYIWPALDAFAGADGQSAWQPVIDSGLALLTGGKFGKHRLPSDWIDVRGDASFVPAQGRPPLFGFDAVRVPLYLMLSGRTAPAADIARYWQSLVAANQALPAWVDVESGIFAPYSLSTGAQAIAERLLGNTALPDALDLDYYSSVLGLMTKLQNV